MFVPAKRGTLLYPSGQTHHLFVFLNEPFGSAQQVLMVPACSIVGRAPPDGTCVVSPGEHDFIVRPSYVAYRYCRIEPAAKLVRGAESGEFVDKGLLRQDVFDRVLAGLHRSKFAGPFAIDFLKEIESKERRKP